MGGGGREVVGNGEGYEGLERGWKGGEEEG